LRPGRTENRRVLARAVAGVVVLGLWGAASVQAVTLRQVAKLVGDCTHRCAGPRGVGERTQSAFGQAVAVSADGNTALIGATDANRGDGSVWVFVRHGGSFEQQGARLVVDCKRHCGGPRGHGQDGNEFSFGAAIALSANGNTALIGAPGNGERGGAWVFTRRHGRWSQQGTVLIAFCHPLKRTCRGPNGTGLGGYGFGSSVALSANGNTGVIGAPGGVGAVWVFTRSGGRWSQQGTKLRGDCNPSRAVCTGPDGTGEAYSGVNTGEFGSAVALSPAGDTVLIGAFGDSPGGNESELGAAWVFTRSGTRWSQQGSKLNADCTTACTGPNGTGASGMGWLGSSVALSSDGNTALLGAPADGSGAGAAWVFTRAGGAWSQQGAKLVADCVPGPVTCTGPNGTGEVNGSDNGGEFGSSVALTADGDTALIGAPNHPACQTCDMNGAAGAAWLFTRSAATWSQAGDPLVGNCTTSCGGANGTGEINRRIGGEFGTGVALSGAGGLAVLGAPQDNCHSRCDGSIGSGGEGAAWIFSLSGL
jgi:hypothetical protein